MSYAPNAKVQATKDGIETLEISKPAAAEPAEDAKKGEDAPSPMAPTSAVFTAFGRSQKVKMYRWLGVICSIVSGTAYPLMSFYFSKSFEKLGAQAGAGGGDAFLKEITEIAYVFMGLGAFGFVFLVLQSFFLEMAASESTADFKQQWFDALLRQDMAYYDIKDVSAQATIVSTRAAKYKRYVFLFIFIFNLKVFCCSFFLCHAYAYLTFNATEGLVANLVKESNLPQLLSEDLYLPFICHGE
jgi:ABC-type multidrug transport system fused ATPase/permease subunit